MSKNVFYFSNFKKSQISKNVQVSLVKNAARASVYRNWVWEVTSGTENQGVFKHDSNIPNVFFSLFHDSRTNYRAGMHRSVRVKEKRENREGKWNEEKSRAINMAYTITKKRIQTAKRTLPTPIPIFHYSCRYTQPYTQLLLFMKGRTRARGRAGEESGGERGSSAVI